jgi:copper chaperone CopZ
MKSFILMAAISLLSAAPFQSQIDNAKTVAVKVYGNCEMCKSTIEQAAKQKKISKADWNIDSKIATITYDSMKTNLDAVLQNIALAGYDNAVFLAPDEAYNNLQGCCKYNREKKAIAKVTVKDAEMKMDHSGSKESETATTMQQANQLQAIFDNYFPLKDALVKSDNATASAKAAELLAAINPVKMETLKTEEHTAWMKVEKDLKTDARHISESKEIEQQRDHFTSLSKNMYTLIKAAKPVDKIYWQNCPMYNDGKGANWLSKESAVKNPYYGSMMLSCGKTVETIQ